MSDITATSVKLTWYYKNPEEVQYYVIQHKPKHVQQAEAEISGITTMYYHVRSLSPYTEYELTVTAVNAIGRGPASAPVTVTTGETSQYSFRLLMLFSLPSVFVHLQKSTSPLVDAATFPTFQGHRCRIVEIHKRYRSFQNESPIPCMRSSEEFNSIRLDCTRLDSTPLDPTRLIRLTRVFRSCFSQKDEHSRSTISKDMEGMDKFFSNVPTRENLAY